MRERRVKVRSHDLRQSARGRDCTMRLAGYVGRPCSGRDTTVLVHIDNAGGKGMRTKETDLLAVHGCATCHALYDGSDPALRKLGIDASEDMLRALGETMSRWVADGLIVVPGAQIID